MSENGIQLPPMPPGNGVALQKVFTSLGLRDIFRDISAGVADSSRNTGQSGPGIQAANGGNIATQASHTGVPAALPETAAPETIRLEDGYSLDNFGDDLQLWNSHAETEISYNNPESKNPSPYGLDTSPFGEVFGACTEALPDGRSQVNYEGPSIFDEGTPHRATGATKFWLMNSHIESEP